MTVLSIPNILRIVPLLPKTTSVLFRANHGLGKSSLVRLFGEMWNLPVIDRRLSQMSGGDLIGLPILDQKKGTDGEELGVTKFLPPDWIMRACKEPCIIFLDELNRGQDEVIQGAFQLALDRECNGWKLHPETRVFSAINTDSKYNVRPVDPALLDRFYVIDVNFHAEAWLQWASENGVHRAVMDHIRNDNEALMPPADYDTSTKVPSPRSWAAFSNACLPIFQQGDVDGQYDYETIRYIAQGYVGNDAAIALISHMKTVRTVTGAQVLEGWRTLRKEQGIDIEDVAFMMGLLDKTSDECRRYHALAQLNEKDTVDEDLRLKHGKNLERFMYDLPNESRPVFWQKLVQGITKVEEMQFVITANPYLAPAICAAFGIPVGKAGVGVMPRASFKLPGETEEQAAERIEKENIEPVGKTPAPEDLDADGNLKPEALIAPKAKLAAASKVVPAPKAKRATKKKV